MTYLRVGTVIVIKFVGVICCWDRGAISALAIGTIAPRYAPA